MLYRLLLSDVGYYVGIAIEAFFAIAAIVLLILLLKYGIPEMKKREPKPKKVKEPPQTYALAYVAGEATGDAPAIEYYAKGTKIPLKLNMFTTPVGKRFDGWSDGTKRYLPSHKFVMPAQAVTLTAQWAEIKKEEPKKDEPVKYAFMYVSGGATGFAPAVEHYEKGAKITLKSNMFKAPADKQFDGWSDGVKKYSAGNEFVMPAQTVTLTAQWADIVKEEAKPLEISVPVSDEQTADGQPEQVDGGTTPDGRPIIVNVYNTHANSEKTVEKEVIHKIEKEEAEDNEGLEFADYTILQLYDLLSDEQKRYFDKLKEAALAKPQAKLTVGRSFFNIKIGKRSILKLRIRRMITVGEYALENDILKDFKKSDPNKTGNAKIKVRPTLVAVTDESTLETALDMIDLVHKQILES